MIKFWALVYRLTGWYSPFAKLAEYRHLKTVWRDVDAQHDHPMNDLNLSGIVSLTVGAWQVDNGFVRSLKRSRAQALQKRSKVKSKRGGCCGE